MSERLRERPLALHRHVLRAGRQLRDALGRRRPRALDRGPGCPQSLRIPRAPIGAAGEAAVELILHVRDHVDAVDQQGAVAAEQPGSVDVRPRHVDLAHHGAGEVSPDEAGATEVRAEELRSLQVVGPGVKVAMGPPRTEIRLIGSVASRPHWIRRRCPSAASPGRSSTRYPGRPRVDIGASATAQPGFRRSVLKRLPQPPPDPSATAFGVETHTHPRKLAVPLPDGRLDDGVGPRQLWLGRAEGRPANGTVSASRTVSGMAQAPRSSRTHPCAAARDFRR
jgi:hypothetical protein